MTKKTKRSDVNSTAIYKKKQIKISDLRKLEKIRENVAGIDVGGEFHYVAAPDPSGKIVVNRFGSFTANLKECVEWLKQCNIASVAMEATGVYWTTLYTMLEKIGIEVVLINPRDLNKMKEKKTDVCDAEYLQLFHSYNLLEGSVILDTKINEVRTITRLREQCVRDAASAIQRMQKALINMNLRLDNVINDISGVTGLAIIQAILSGERDPKMLAQLRDYRIKKSEEEIEESLHGFYQDDQLFALGHALREYKFYMNEIQKCDQTIEAKLGEFATHASYQEAVEEQLETAFSKGKKKQKSYEFSFDVKKEVARITGVDLTLLPGIGPSTALTLLAETGLDMRKWKTAKHFASWIGLSANNRITGGKIIGRRTKKGKKKIAATLRMAVTGLYREANNTALGCFFRRKRTQLGSPKAITAAANKLARMYYITMSTGKPFQEMGAQAYMELQKEKQLKKVKKQVAQWGYKLVPFETQDTADLIAEKA